MKGGSVELVNYLLQNASSCGGFGSSTMLPFNYSLFATATPSSTGCGDGIEKVKHLDVFTGMPTGTPTF